MLHSPVASFVSPIQDRLLHLCTVLRLAAWHTAHHYELKKAHIICLLIFWFIVCLFFQHVCIFAKEFILVPILFLTSTEEEVIGKI